MILEEVDTKELANSILKHASHSRNEEDIKIRIETLFEPIRKRWNIDWAAYESRHELSGGRKDALYGTVIIEYKSPRKLEKRSEFNKAKAQIRRYISNTETPSKYFGVILDGYNISFLRLRKNVWEEQDEPLEINSKTVLRLLEAIRGLRRKPIDSTEILLDFGPRSEICKLSISVLYKSLMKSKNARTKMLFEDWKRVFSQVCAYSPKKLQGLAKYYNVEDLEAVNVEKLLFATHTYYTILMKLLTSEIVTLFADSLLGSYLKRLEEAYYKSEMKDELKELEEGGIFREVGIRNFLEADYFAWYLDEWDKRISESIFNIVVRLLDYEPATIELNPERVKDLFKHLYQNLVPRGIRHKLGEYFTPDWLAELVLDEVKYDGSVKKRVLDPACGSGTFLVLAIRRMREYADTHFLDKRSLVKNIVTNVVGIDLNPLAVLASKANYLIALSDLLRYRPREGIEIPIYLADAVSVLRRMTPYGEDEYELNTNQGKFFVTKEIVEEKLLSSVLTLINECAELELNKQEFKKLLNKKINLTDIASRSLLKLYEKIAKLESSGKNKIWTSLLRNSFAPMLIGKFDYVVGNPPWINWSELPKSYRENTKNIWIRYGLTKATLGGGLGKVERDMSMLFLARCFDRFSKNKSGKLAFLIPFTDFKTQAGAGFRRFLSYKCKVMKIHDLVELYPFEGTTNRTSLLIIKHGKTKFPIKSLVWSNPNRNSIFPEDELQYIIDSTNRNKMIMTPINERKPESSWMIISKLAHNALRKSIGKSKYVAHLGVDSKFVGIYWIDILSKQKNEILITNRSKAGRKKVKERKKVIEKDLVYPLMRGRDVKRWFGEASGYMIVPHESNGKPLRETKMKTNYTHTYSFLHSFKDELLERSIYKLWGKNDPFYAIYDIGRYTFRPYKLVWRYISGKISGKGEFSATVINSKSDKFLGEKIIIPDCKLILVPFMNQDEANYVAAILNSSISQLIVMSYTVETAISTHVLKHINVPKFDPKNKLHMKLSNSSKKAHKLSRKIYLDNNEMMKIKLENLEAQIDLLVAKTFKISLKELEAIKDNLTVFRTGK